MSLLETHLLLILYCLLVNTVLMEELLMLNHAAQEVKGEVLEVLQEERVVVEETQDILVEQLRFLLVVCPMMLLMNL